MSIQLRDGLANQSVDLVLEDLLVRFLVNVPDEDLSSIERVFFQVEEAQWFYTDFVRQLNPELPGMKMKSFSAKFLGVCPLIWKWGNPSDAISRFGKYKSTIPVRGVALFNKDLTRLVLVKGMESNSWSFPRGKISKDESDLECAIREAEEETGFNARDYINEHDSIERTIKGKNYKIYLAKNVPQDFDFQPIARNEIAKIEWHDLKSLQYKTKANPLKYFIVAPILKPLTKWVNKNKGILNEEELMLKAEIKLKTLLGINQPKQENIDAGRDLLNILQGVTSNNEISNVIGNESQPSTQSNEQFINMNLPQYLHNQIPFFNNQPANIPYGYPVPNHPFFFPPVPPPVPPMDHFGSSAHLTPSQHNAHLNFSPAAVSLPVQQRSPLKTDLPIPVSNSNRRSTEANSKELLSILNRNPTSDKSNHGDDSSHTNLNGTEINKSKADHLLNLFKRKTEQANESFKQNNPIDDAISASHHHDSFLATNHEPSNELERSIQTFHDFGKPGKKPTILKRSDRPPTDGKASADILSLLGNPTVKKESESLPLPKSSPINSNKEHNNASVLLGLLNKNNTSSSQLKQQLTQAPESHHPENRSAAHELLGLLGQKKVQPQTLQVKDEAINEGNNFEDFEDFENFDDFNGSGHDNNSLSSSELKHLQFDVASDDEDSDPNIYHDANTFNENFSHKHPTLEQNLPKPTRSEEKPKNRIRILKPGESLSDVASKEDNPSNTEKRVQVAPNPSFTQHGENNDHRGSPDYTSIYGTNTAAPNNHQSQNELHLPFEVSNSSSSNTADSQSFKQSFGSEPSLLDIIGRRPPQPQVPSSSTFSNQQKPLTLDDIEYGQSGKAPVFSNSSQTFTTQLPPAEGHSSARDLLNILKGGGSSINPHSASSQL